MDATDAYYQELLDISISALLAQTMPIHAFSDCSSAISLSGVAVGHLQHGSLLVDLRAFEALQHPPLTLTWTPPTRNAISPNPNGRSSTGASIWLMQLRAPLFLPQ